MELHNIINFLESWENLESPIPILIVTCLAIGILIIIKGTFLIYTHLSWKWRVLHLNEGDLVVYHPFGKADKTVYLGQFKRRESFKDPEDRTIYRDEIVVSMPSIYKASEKVKKISYKDVVDYIPNPGKEMEADEYFKNWVETLLSDAGCLDVYLSSPQMGLKQALTQACLGTIKIECTAKPKEEPKAEEENYSEEGKGIGGADLPTTEENSEAPKEPWGFNIARDADGSTRYYVNAQKVDREVYWKTMARLLRRTAVEADSISEKFEPISGETFQKELRAKYQFNGPDRVVVDKSGNGNGLIKLKGNPEEVPEETLATHFLVDQCTKKFELYIGRQARIQIEDQKEFIEVFVPGTSPDLDGEDLLVAVNTATGEDYLISATKWKPGVKSARLHSSNTHTFREWICTIGKGVQLHYKLGYDSQMYPIKPENFRNWSVEKVYESQKEDCSNVEESAPVTVIRVLNNYYKWLTTNYPESQGKTTIQTRVDEKSGSISLFVDNAPRGLQKEHSFCITNLGHKTESWLAIRVYVRSWIEEPQSLPEVKPSYICSCQ